MVVAPEPGLCGIQEVMISNKSRGATQKGVEALQLRCLSRISEFEARTESRICSQEASATPQVAQHSPCDLLSMQPRDPTMPVYKSSMFDRGYAVLLEKWKE